MTPGRRAACLWIGALVLAWPVAQADTAAPDTPPYQSGAASADGTGKRYMGREIAQVMGWQGAAWLERTERQQEERTDLLLLELRLRSGMTVADIGAGTGYIARRIARAVGPSGAVYAVDVQPEMIRMLDDLARREKLAQIRPVLGADADVRLPATSIDLAIMVDVYHELEFPYEVLASIVKALKPGGRVVFVEYRAEDASVPIKPLHKMSVAQIRREVASQPLQLERVAEPLPWQHIVVFTKR